MKILFNITFVAFALFFNISCATNPFPQSEAGGGDIFVETANVKVLITRSSENINVFLNGRELYIENLSRELDFDTGKNNKIIFEGRSNMNICYRIEFERPSQVPEIIHLNCTEDEHK